jgi:hypothetical protein
VGLIFFGKNYLTAIFGSFFKFPNMVNQAESTNAFAADNGTAKRMYRTGMLHLICAGRPKTVIRAFYL